MPFHNGSTFYFLGGILAQSNSWVMVVVLRCPSYMFLFQLSTISFTLRQRAITGTTHLVSWLSSSIVSCRKKQGSSLPLVEQWVEYVLANHSKFPAIADGKFLSRTRVLAALNKIGSCFLKLEVQRDARRFVEEFTISVLSTVAARSKVGQGLSCFCPAIIFGGDNHAPLHLLGLLLDALLECVWMKGGEIEASRAEYQSLSKSNDSWSGLRRGAALT